MQPGSEDKDIVDYGTITDCTDEFGNIGLMCGSKCLTMDKWCTDKKKEKLTDLRGFSRKVLDLWSTKVLHMIIMVLSYLKLI